MSNTEDRNDETINLDLDEHTSAEDADMDVNTEANANADDDFDYLKEIEEIEAQEKELEEQRQKKKEELERRREEREKDDKKSAAQRKREMKERKKEAEWLGEPFEDDVEIVPTAKKKKSKKGLVAIVVIVLIALAGGAAFAYKMQADKKELADFSQKVAAFQSEKLDGRDFGSYFTDFMKECQDAIDAGDLKKMEDLDKKWSEVENTYTTVSNGKTSLDAFASGIDQALSTYSITDDYKATYETLKKDVEAAQKDCDYEKVSDFQKQLDALATNLKSDNLKVIQNLKNDISSVSLDKDYVSADDQKKLDAYSTEVEKYIKEENYAQAVTTLSSWKTDVTALKKTIDDKKAAEQAKAESEAESKRAAESKAAESKAAESKAAESKKNQTTETKKDSSKKDSSKNNSSSSNSSASSDYVLPGSSSQYLSASDVKNLSSYQLMIARNEIYARHGRKFNDSELQAYFNGKSWYKGTVNPEDFSTSVFNDCEIKNIQLIQSYE